MDQTDLEMPELPEVRLMRLWLAKRIVGVEFALVSKCMGYNDLGQEASLKSFNADCPQKCVEVNSRGKELAIVFEHGTLVFQLAMGGFFGMRPAAALTQSPVKDLVNMIFKVNKVDQHLLLLESDQFRNFVRVRYVKEGPVFNTEFGPDVLSNQLALKEHIKNSLQKFKSKFKQSSLFEILDDQQFFNGIGSYTKNEILERVFMSLRVPPWINSFEFLSDGKKLSSLIAIAAKYLDHIISWVGSDFDLLVYNEKNWLDFKSLFLRVFRKRGAKTVPVLYYKVGSDQCYTTAVGTLNYQQGTNPSWFEDPFDIPTHWHVNERPLLISKGSLNVGIYHWYSKTMLAKMHLECNEANINLYTTEAKQFMEETIDELDRKRKAQELKGSPTKKAKKLPKIDPSLLVVEAENKVQDEVIQPPTSLEVPSHDLQDTKSEEKDGKKKKRHKLNKVKRALLRNQKEMKNLASKFK